MHWLSDRLLYDNSKLEVLGLKYKHPLSVRRHFWFILKTATAARLVRMQFQIHSYIHHCQEESGREHNGFKCFYGVAIVFHNICNFYIYQPVKIVKCSAGCSSFGPKIFWVSSKFFGKDKKQNLGEKSSFRPGTKLFDQTKIDLALYQIYFGSTEDIRSERPIWSKNISEIDECKKFCGFWYTWT